MHTHTRTYMHTYTHMHIYMSRNYPYSQGHFHELKDRSGNVPGCQEAIGKNLSG